MTSFRPLLKMVHRAPTHPPARPLRKCAGTSCAKKALRTGARRLRDLAITMAHWPKKNRPFLLCQKQYFFSIHVIPTPRRGHIVIFFPAQGTPAHRDCFSGAQAKCAGKVRREGNPYAPPAHGYICQMAPKRVFSLNMFILMHFSAQTVFPNRSPT